jgi:hypothetical protein
MHTDYSGRYCTVHDTSGSFASIGILISSSSLDPDALVTFGDNTLKTKVFFITNLEFEYRIVLPGYFTWFDS